MILLPWPPTRACLRAFWACVSLAVGVAAGILLLLLGLDAAAAWTSAGVVSAVVATPGIIQPYLVAVPYRGWNWVARRVADRASTYIAGVCLLTLSLAGRSGSSPSRFVATSADTSMWSPRETQPPAAYRSQYHDARVQTPGGRWSAPLRSLSKHSGNSWAARVIPFLSLLRLLDADSGRGRSTASRGNYTLY